MSKTSKKNKHQNNFEPENEELLDIPEDEIWTYQIEGLQKPRIVDKSITLRSKVIIVVVLFVAICLSIYFSVRAVSNDEFKYKEAQTGYELIKYSNVDDSTEVTIDYVGGDKSKPVTILHEYAFNCDEKIVTINLGKDIAEIDGKSFYSCWNLENVFVDDSNPYYCDIDGVLYNKDLTEIIFYPTAHNLALTRNAGYTVAFPEDGSLNGDDFTYAADFLSVCLAEGKDLSALEGDDLARAEPIKTICGTSDYEKFIKDYNDKVGFYILPSTVTKIGKLSFAYSDIFSIYIPEGVKNIETMAFFKAEKLRNVYSYTTDTVIDGTVYSDYSGSISAYKSLPEGLEEIGSDAFTYDRGVTYMFVPESVKVIGHHAFFNMCYKENDNLVGLSKVNVVFDEDTFKNNVKAGDSWLPQFDSGLFKKNVEVVYSSEREKLS